MVALGYQEIIAVLSDVLNEYVEEKQAELAFSVKNDTNFLNAKLIGGKLLGAGAIAHVLGQRIKKLTGEEEFDE